MLTVLIVILHANMVQLCIGPVRFYQQMMTAEVTRIAVPLFFMISGFLFFINYRGSVSDYKRKLLSRTRSLLIPYFSFLLLGSIIVFLKEGSHSFGKLLEIIKGGIIGSPPIFYPLWFLRDLYVMALLSPLVYWIVKKIPVSLVVLIVIWALGKNPFIFPMTEAMLFFSLGCFLTTQTKILEPVNHKYTWWYFFLWLLLCFLNTYGKNVLPLPYVTHCVVLLFGIYSVWILYDRLYPHFNEKIKNADIYKYSFFIYLIHEPILTILKKIGLYLLGQSSWSIGVIYILAPILTIFIAYAIGRGMNKYIPKIFSLITGGRTKRDLNTISVIAKS